MNKKQHRLSRFPWGTILGPILSDTLCKRSTKKYEECFNTILRWWYCHLSSDDTWFAARERLKEYLKRMSIWMKLNNLYLNVDKTVYITHGNYYDSVPDTLNINIGKHIIKVAKYYQYLGILRLWHERGQTLITL